MIVFPPAKINLGLRITGKRPDGYHEIDTVMLQIPLFDILEIVPTTSFLFTSGGNSVDCPPEMNLCVKAYYLLKSDFDLPPVHIHLHKIIPMGAGLGGGSSDAAYTLLALNELFQLQLNRKTLENYAAQLGSDCPFFISSSPKYCTGRGEIMKDIEIPSLSEKWLKLYDPKIHISTSNAYSGIRPQAINKTTEEQVLEPLSDWSDFLINDFETTVFQENKTISQLKNQLYKDGALYAAMSGSGSAVYGVFEHIPKKNLLSIQEWVFQL